MEPTLLWDDLVTRALESRAKKLAGNNVVTREGIAPEQTPFGVVRWYMHPKIEDISDWSLYFFELEIPAGSRSGRLTHQGGLIHLVVEGRGHTVLDGERHDWENLDAIAVPARPEGVVLQHFNDGDGPVRLLVTFANFDSALGPELGVALEVLDPCPEWVAAN